MCLSGKSELTCFPSCWGLIGSHTFFFTHYSAVTLSPNPYIWRYLLHCQSVVNHLSMCPFQLLKRRPQHNTDCWTPQRKNIKDNGVVLVFIVELMSTLGIGPTWERVYVCVHVGGRDSAQCHVIWLAFYCYSLVFIDSPIRLFRLSRPPASWLCHRRSNCCG